MEPPSKCINDKKSAEIKGRFFYAQIDMKNNDLYTILSTKPVFLWISKVRSLKIRSFLSKNCV